MESGDLSSAVRSRQTAWDHRNGVLYVPRAMSSRGGYPDHCSGTTRTAGLTFVPMAGEGVAGKARAVVPLRIRPTDWNGQPPFHPESPHLNCWPLRSTSQGLADLVRALRPQARAQVVVHGAESGDMAFALTTNIEWLGLPVPDRRLLDTPCHPLDQGNRREAENDRQEALVEARSRNYLTWMCGEVEQGTEGDPPSRTPLVPMSRMRMLMHEAEKLQFENTKRVTLMLCRPHRSQKSTVQSWHVNHRCSHSLPLCHSRPPARPRLCHLKHQHGCPSHNQPLSHRICLRQKPCRLKGNVNYGPSASGEYCAYPTSVRSFTLRR